MVQGEGIVAESKRSHLKRERKLPEKLRSIQIVDDDGKTYKRGLFEKRVAELVSPSTASRAYYVHTHTNTHTNTQTHTHTLSLSLSHTAGSTRSDVLASAGNCLITWFARLMPLVSHGRYDACPGRIH